MMKYTTLIVLTILFLKLLYSCAEITTEISGKDYYEKDQLAVVGYLSNFGAVVNLQKTRSPLGESSTSTSVSDAVVELLDADNDNVVATFNKYDDFNYATPESFLPENGKSYYIKVLAPNFSTLTSTPQQIISMPSIDAAELLISESVFSGVDTTVYLLFGKPRTVWLTYYINNADSAITNNFSKLLFRYKTELFDYTSGNYIKHSTPHFFFNLGSGVNHFTNVPNVFSMSHWFFDQIKTDDTIVYNGQPWQVIDRVESVIIQSVLFSSDFVVFFEGVNDYLENRTDPFSIMSEKIPSNMSNEIGFFGSVFIDEEEIVLPEEMKDTIVVDFYEDK